MPYIYGDSYGDLGNRVLATQAQRDANYFNSLAANRAQQELNDKSQDRDQNMALAMAQLGLTSRGQDIAQQNQAADLDYRNRALLQNNNLAGQQINSTADIARMQLLAQESRLNKADQSQAYNEIYQAIANGNINTPQDLDLFTGNKLNSNEKLRLTGYLQQQQTRKQAAYDSAARAAENLNQIYTQRIAPYQAQQDELAGKMATAPDSGHVGGWINPMNWGLKTKADLQLQSSYSPYNTERDKLFTAFDKSKRLSGQVDFDPITRQFIPILPRPESASPVPGGAMRFPPVPPGYSGNSGPHDENYGSTNVGITSVPSAGPETPIVNWVPVAKAGLRVHPATYADIQQKAMQYSNPSDRDTFVRTALAHAVVAGQAVRTNLPDSGPNMANRRGQNIADLLPAQPYRY